MAKLRFFPALLKKAVILPQRAPTARGDLQVSPVEEPLVRSTPPEAPERKLSDELADVMQQSTDDEQMQSQSLSGDDQGCLGCDSDGCPSLRASGNIHAPARALPHTELFANLGYLFWSSKHGSRKTYSMTREMEEGAMYDFFISHSWEDSGLIKYIAMCIFFNGRMATIVTAFLFICIVTLRLCGVTMPGYKFEAFGGTNYNSIVLLCSCVPCFLLALLGGHALRSTWRTLMGLPAPTFFLDKCCIHQTDPTKKRAGILNLGTFIDRTDKLIVMMTSRYFTRVWCMYELASWVRTHRTASNICALPLTQTVASAVCFMGCCCAAAAFHLGDWSGVFNTICNYDQPLLMGMFPLYGFLVFCAPPGIMFGLMFPVLAKAAREEQQIASTLQVFDIRDAGAFSEDDKTDIILAIDEMQGVDSFNHQIRTTFSSLLQIVSHSTMAHYQTWSISALPCLLWGVDMALMDPTWDLKSRDLYFGSALAFIYVPTYTLMLSKLARHLTSTFAVCLGTAIAIITAVCMMLFSIGAFLGFSQLHCAIVYIVSALAAFGTVALVARFDPQPVSGRPRITL